MRCNASAGRACTGTAAIAALVTVPLAVVLAAPAAAGAQTTTPAAATAPELLDAARVGDTATVRALIDAGARVDAAHGDGATALHWAAHRDDLEAAGLLIEAGADVNAANALGATPLWLAAKNGSAPMVERLLEAGANPNVSLRMGETPLMSAARSGSAAAVELLLAHDADVNAAERERGQTALMWGAAQQHPEVVRLLVDRGADLHARTRVWDQLENTAGNTNTSGNFRMAHGGSTALLFAARNGDVDTSRVLVEAGADVNDTAAAGTSALVLAAHSGHGPIGIYLLEQGADPNAADAGYTALHAAVLRGQIDLADALLARGAYPNAVVEHGTPGRRFSADYSIRHQTIGANAFWLAAQYGEPEILRALAKHGANPHLSPGSGMSSLKAAIGVAYMSQENRRNRVGASEDGRGRPGAVDARPRAYRPRSRRRREPGRQSREHPAPRRGARRLRVGRRAAGVAWRRPRRHERAGPDAAGPGGDQPADPRHERPARDATGHRGAAARARRERLTCDKVDWSVAVECYGKRRVRRRSPRKERAAAPETSRERRPCYVRGYVRGHAIRSPRRSSPGSCAADRWSRSARTCHRTRG